MKLNCNEITFTLVSCVVDVTRLLHLLLSVGRFWSIGFSVTFRHHVNQMCQVVNSLMSNATSETRTLSPIQTISVLYHVALLHLMPATIKYI